MTRNDEWVRQYGLNEKNIEILEFVNVPTNIIYVWDKTTQQYYERKSIPYPMPIKMNKIQWRNVTGCFDWNQAIKENKLPPEKSLLQKAYCFIFSCIYTD